MRHIEFIGPPGGGKSTLRSQLLLNKQPWIGIEEQEIFTRYLSGKLGKFTVNLLSVAPKRVKNMIYYKYIWDKIKNDLIGEFVINNSIDPSFVFSEINKCDYGLKNIINIALRTMQKYGMVSSVADTDELILADELFFQLACGIAWRKDSLTLPSDDYFSKVPLPQLLVVVDASVETCISRQEQRGRITSSNNWFETAEESTRAHRNICKNISKRMNNIDKLYINTDNKSVIESKTEMYNKLRKLNIIC